MRPILPGSRANRPRAGLVLLFAPNFHEVPPAFVFDHDRVLIGREPASGGLRLRQDAVSRLHAQITYEDGGWQLQDLGSRNGTFVNGRVMTNAALQAFDEIRFGDAIFKFVAADADLFVPYRLDGTSTPAGLPASQEMVGGGQIRRLLAELKAVAPSDIAVLVRGNTGTGKELIARAVHQASGRPGAFAALNCAAIPPTLLESELFGFKRGAFTGAHKDKPGLVSTAQHGTLFLDEIGDLSFEAQAKLLRVIETREFLPLGATQGEHVDVRLICATHRDLDAMVESGSFRPDLFARIQGYSVRLPPLRERKEDLYMLVRHFLTKHGHAERKVSFAWMAALCRYHWPFNVRELEAAVRRAVAVTQDLELDAPHLPDSISNALDAPTSRNAPPRAGKAPTAEELSTLLERHNGNIAATARALGKDRAQVHRWLRQAGLDVDAFRGRDPQDDE